MEMTLDVSVIIVNFNAGPGLVECVKTVIQDAHEVIVVDNASSDSSLIVLTDEFHNERKLAIIRNDVNFGFAKACNIGAGVASGRYFLFLNPDCELDSLAMSELVHAVQSDSRVGMAGGLLLNPDGSEQAGGRRAIPTPWRSFVRAFGLGRLFSRWPRLFSDFYLHKQPLPDCVVEVEAISGACMMVRPEAIAEVKLLDEGYFMHCEDLDWCMRFRQEGWKVVFVPGARVLHHKGVSSRSRPIAVEWYKHKGMIRFYSKFFRHQYPGALMWLVVIAVWARFFAVAGYFGFKQVAQRFIFGRR